MWAGGGSVGDMAANAELQSRTAPTTYDPDTTGKVTPSFRDQYGETVDRRGGQDQEVGGGGMPSGLASMGGSAMPILGQVGGIPDYAGDWLKRYFEGMAEAGQAIPGYIMEELKGEVDVRDFIPPGLPQFGGGGGGGGGFTQPGFDQAKADAQQAERDRSYEVLAASDVTPGSIPEKPLWQKDLFEDMDTRVGAYTGETLIQPIEGEGGDPFPSQTEPGVTGFKTVDDFDIPQIKSFLSGLSEEARTGQMGMVMAPAILDAFTAINQQRQVGNIDLAKKNTDAAVAFLDRAAMVARRTAAKIRVRYCYRANNW